MQSGVMTDAAVNTLPHSENQNLLITILVICMKIIPLCVARSGYSQPTQRILLIKPIDYIKLIQVPLCPHCLAGFMDEQLNTRVTCGKANITLITGLPCSYQDWLECPLNKDAK